MTTTSELYDSDASEWQRTEPVLRTDFTARPIHKTFGDYFHAFAEAGFTTLAELHGVRVEDAQLALDPPFFTPLRDQPLHVAFRLRVD